MSVQISSLQVKALAKNLRQTMTYGYLSKLLQEVVTNPDLVQRLDSAIGKKKDKPIKQTSADKLVGYACGFDSYESAAGVRSTKYLESIDSDEVLLERLNTWTPPKNRVIFMEQNLPLLMKTFPSLTENQAMQLLLSDYFLFFNEETMYFRTSVWEGEGNVCVRAGMSSFPVYGLISVVRDQFDQEGSLVATLSGEIFRENLVWGLVGQSKELPSAYRELIGDVERINGFLQCSAKVSVRDVDTWSLVYRVDESYESSFQWLVSACVNDPLSPFLRDGAHLLEDKREVFTDSFVHDLLIEAIDNLREDSRFTMSWSDKSFLKLASMLIWEIDDSKYEFYRRVNASSDERAELIDLGVLEEAPECDDYPAWDITYQLTTTEDFTLELTVEEEARLFQWDGIVAYNGWKHGFAYPPRVAKIIWDDFSRFLREIGTDMQISNRFEVIAKMELLTANRGLS